MTGEEPEDKTVEVSIEVLLRVLDRAEIDMRGMDDHGPQGGDVSPAVKRQRADIADLRKAALAAL